MKRISLLKALLATLLLVPPIAAHAYDLKKTNLSTCYYNILYTASGGFAYNSDGNMEMELTYASTSYNTYSGTIHVHEYAAYSATKYCYCMGIGKRACYNSTGLEKVVFNKASLISYIDDEAFYNCTSLTDLDLSSTNITSIGGQAFANCTSISSLDLSGLALESLGDSAFYNCTSLTKIDLSKSTITSIPDYAFAGCTNLYSVTLPSTVTSIGAHAFDGCDFISFSIPSSVTSIGDYAFSKCYILSSLTLPSSLQTIGKYAFQGNLLQSISIPASVTSIGADAFILNGSLKTVTFEGTSPSLTSLGEFAFAYCDALTTVTGLGNTKITSIGRYTFFETPITSIDIPLTVTSIGEYAFCDCTSLTTVNYNAINCTSAGTADYPTFYGCTALANVTIGDEVTTIPDYLFDGYYSNSFSNLKSITIPSNVKSIGDCSFYYCRYLTTVTMNSTVLTSIDSSAFECCSKLTSINLPSTLTSIGGWAFKECSALKTIYSFSITPPKCKSNETFRLVSSSCILYVPAGAETAYGGYSSSYSYNWSSLSTVRTFHLLDVVAKADPEVQGNEEGYGYMTFFNGDYTYTLPEGMKASTVTALGYEDKLTMAWEYKAGDVIPANTAVILYGKVDEFMAMVDYDSSDTSKYGTIEDGTVPETNWLHGVWSTDDLYTDEDYTDGVVFAYDEDGSKTVDNYLFYTLNYDGIDEDTGVYKDIGFYWSAEDGGPFSIAAKKAWLAIPKDAANEAKFSTFLFGDNGETTGIKAVNTSATDEVRAGDGYIYNLAGQRVNDMSHCGIYIVDGKKVVKK